MSTEDQTAGEPKEPAQFGQGDTTSSGSDGRPLNLLFLCADDHRWDALGGPYLGAHPAGLKTPAWDRLAREGAHLTHCFTTVPICTPARAELLTGCDAFRTGVRWFGEKTDPTLETLAGVFGRSGYETFFTGKWHNDGTPGERGYARTRRVKVGGMWDHRLTFEENGRKVTGFSTELFAEAAIEFLREPQRRERPWYAPPIARTQRRCPCPPTICPCTRSTMGR
jgi:arylsulfatase A-like enzyme